MILESITLLFYIIMLGQSLCCVVKLSCFPTKIMAVISILWGLAGYLSVQTASETGNVENVYGLLQSLMLMVTFVECGIMIAYCIDSECCSRSMLYKMLLKFYPGFMVFFPIIGTANFTVRNFPGTSFVTLGVIFGISTTVIIFMAAYFFQRTFRLMETRINALYYISIFMVFLCILTSGLKTN